MIWRPNIGFADGDPRGLIAYNESLLPIVSADIPNAFILGVSRTKPAKAQWPLSVRVRPLELAQQPVAALDGGIKRLLRGFLAGESLLQVLVDRDADENRPPHPHNLKMTHRRVTNDCGDSNGS